MSHPKARLALTALATLALAGCVDFDREIVVVVNDPGRKEVRALFIYEGLHVNGSKPEDLEKARNQLTQFVNSGQEFCLIDNWISHVVLTADPKEDPRAEAVKGMLRGELTVRNEAIYVENGKLCGYQTVTARDGQKLVAELNKAGSMVMTAAVAEQRARANKANPDFSEESLKKLDQAAKDGFAWLELRPGRLRFTLPISPADAKKMRDDALNNKEFVNALLKDNPVKLEADDAGFRVSLGEGDGKPIRYAIKNSNKGEGSYRPELQEFAQTLKVPFKEALTTEKVIADFLKGGK
jgi:hypothetical protein